MKQMTLNLNSFATILFTCDFYAYKEVPVTSDEWHEVERILKIHGLHGPASLFGLTSDEMMDMLNISEFVAYKLSCRIKTISTFLKLLNDLNALERKIDLSIKKQERQEFYQSRISTLDEELAVDKLDTGYDSKPLKRNLKK